MPRGVLVESLYKPLNRCANLSGGLLGSLGLFMKVSQLGVGANRVHFSIPTGGETHCVALQGAEVHVDPLSLSLRLHYGD